MSDNAYGTSGHSSFGCFLMMYCICVHQGQDNSVAGSGVLQHLMEIIGHKPTYSLIVIIPMVYRVHLPWFTFDGKLYCIREGQDDSGWLWCATFDGVSWSTDELIPTSDNAYGTGTPAFGCFLMMYCIVFIKDGDKWLALVCNV
jgi:chitinase